MMRTNKVLILTDHKSHTAENSLYDLAVKMYQHPKTFKVDIASRLIDTNSSFFSSDLASEIFATTIDENFSYKKLLHPLNSGIKKVKPDQYDLVWLRLPPPLDPKFLDFVERTFSKSIIINHPQGILKTGSKSFLLNFQSVCPPMKICRSLDDVIEFKSQFDLVLKPFREYGGRGIIKIENDLVDYDNKQISFDEFSENLPKDFEYLAVKFLKNVDQGDKRIIVVNGEIMGASLRLPAPNSWLCNVSMGGTSHHTEICHEEIEVVTTVNPILNELGIVMYGLDTLVDDNGKRVLSEINTTSIGGLPQIANLKQEPLVEKAIDLIWDYYENK